MSSSASSSLRARAAPRSRVAVSAESEKSTEFSLRSPTRRSAEVAAAPAAAAALRLRAAARCGAKRSTPPAARCAARAAAARRRGRAAAEAAARPSSWCRRGRAGVAAGAAAGAPRRRGRRGRPRAPARGRRRRARGATAPTIAISSGTLGERQPVGHPVLPDVGVVGDDAALVLDDDLRRGQRALVLVGDVDRPLVGRRPGAASGEDARSRPRPRRRHRRRAAPAAPGRRHGGAGRGGRASLPLTTMVAPHFLHLILRSCRRLSRRQSCTSPGRLARDLHCCPSRSGSRAWDEHPPRARQGGSDRHRLTKDSVHARAQSRLRPVRRSGGRCRGRRRARQFSRHRGGRVLAAEVGLGCRSASPQVGQIFAAIGLRGAAGAGAAGRTPARRGRRGPSGRPARLAPSAGSSARRAPPAALATWPRRPRRASDQADEAERRREAADDGHESHLRAPAPRPRDRGAPADGPGRRSRRPRPASASPASFEPARRRGARRSARGWRPRRARSPPCRRPTRSTLELALAGVGGDGERARRVDGGLAPRAAPARSTTRAACRVGQPSASSDHGAEGEAVARAHELARRVHLEPRRLAGRARAARRRPRLGRRLAAARRRGPAVAAGAALARGARAASSPSRRTSENERERVDGGACRSCP